MTTKLLACFGELILAVCAAAQTAPDTAPEANPARPTVSTPAALTPVGYLQFETGGLGAVTSPEFGTRNETDRITPPGIYGVNGALYS
jgi:hypothetical protein